MVDLRIEERSILKSLTIGDRFIDENGEEREIVEIEADYIIDKSV